MFTFREQDGLPGLTWCLKFASEDFSSWKEAFTVYLWEGKNRTSYAKTKNDEQRYIQDAYNDVEMEDADHDEAVEEEELDEEDEEERSETNDEQDDDLAESFHRGAKNEQLAVGYKNDLSYVTRGDMIGVFAPKDDKLRFRTTIDKIQTTDGKSFVPQKVCPVNHMYLTKPRSCCTIKIATCSCSTPTTAMLSIEWISSTEKLWMSGRSLTRSK